VLALARFRRPEITKATKEETLMPKHKRKRTTKKCQVSVKAQSGKRWCFAATKAGRTRAVKKARSVSMTSKGPIVLRDEKNQKFLVFRCGKHTRR
jgi:hypothetical protein